MTEGWVVDASIAAKWVLPEPDSEHAAGLRGARLVAPELLDVECASILWKAARRGELAAEEAAEHHALLLNAPVERVPNVALLPLAMGMALDLGHPVYDCLYVAVAELTGFPLVTADRRLRALRWHGVRILGLDELP